MAIVSEMHSMPVQARELAPGLTWIIQCLAVPAGPSYIHSHASAYLVAGKDRCALIDTGYPRMWPGVERCLDDLLEGRELDVLVPTHPELPHAGNLPLLMEKYPQSQVYSDTRDYAAYFGSPVERLHAVRPGDVLDLGDLRLTFVEAVIRDLPASIWAYEETTQTLFVADGFSFSHEHEAGQCHLKSSELPFEPREEQIGFVSQRALYWTTFADLTRMFERLDELLTRYPPRLIAPAHGSVIDNPAQIIPLVKDGMRGVSQARV